MYLTNQHPVAGELLLADDNQEGTEHQQGEKQPGKKSDTLFKIGVNFLVRKISNLLRISNLSGSALFCADIQYLFVLQ